MTVEQAAAVKSLQRALGFPRLVTQSDLAGLGPVVQVQPQPAKAAPAAKPEGSRRERAQKQSGRGGWRCGAEAQA